jgi:hypothetical protein
VTAGKAFGSLVVASLIWTVLSVVMALGFVMYFGWRDWLQAETVESGAPVSATTGA